MAKLNINKPIRAATLVRKPERIEELSGIYIMLKERSGNRSYPNMIKALNLLAEKGWVTVSVTTDNGLMLAVVMNTRPQPQTPQNAQAGN